MNEEIFEKFKTGLPLIFKAKCLGEDLCGICLDGEIKETSMGRYNLIEKCRAEDSSMFKCIGELNKMIIKEIETNMSVVAGFDRKVKGSGLALFHSEAINIDLTFCLNDDMTLSIIVNEKSDLKLGIVKDGKIGLVDNEDEEHILFFQFNDKETITKYSKKIHTVDNISLFKKLTLNENSHERDLIEKNFEKGFPLLFKTKKNGDVISGISVSGEVYNIKTKDFEGKGQAMTVCPLEESSLFSFDGELDSMVIRYGDERKLAIEIEYRKYKVNNPLSLWYTKTPPLDAIRFCLNEDSTISALDSENKKTSEFYMGEANNRIVLVDKDDERKMFFQFSDEVTKKYFDDLERFEQKKINDDEASRVIYKEKAEKLLSKEVLCELKKNGCIHLPDLIDKALINKAKRAVNKELGNSEKVSEFKAAKIVFKSEVIDIYSKTILPHLVHSFFGYDKANAKADYVQLALRFPGDMCQGNTFNTNEEHFRTVANQWHIDGCASDYLPGITDNWGTVKNFDMLIGVLLADVDEPMSGEFCTYYGSHGVLADMCKDGGLEKLYEQGVAFWPYEKTEQLLGRPVNCTGKAGDVFIVNHMNAHFIAPNTSPNIRYAAYFRIKSPAFKATADGNDHCAAAMLDPWVNWPIMKDIDI